MAREEWATSRKRSGVREKRSSFITRADLPKMKTALRVLRYTVKHTQLIKHQWIYLRFVEISGDCGCYKRFMTTEGLIKLTHLKTLHKLKKKNE